MISKIKRLRVPPEARIIGSNLRILREASGFSRAEAARLLRVSVQQVQKYETGQNRFPVEKLYALRAAFGVSYERFFAGLGREETKDSRDVEAWAIYQKMRKLDDLPLKRKIRKIVNVLTD